MIDYHVVVEGPFAHNTVILWDEESLKGFLLDPGSPDKEVEAFIKRHHIEIQAIVLTHTHLDHVGAVQHYRGQYQWPYYMHPGEKSVLAYAQKSCVMYGLPVFDVPNVNEARWLKEGDRLKLGSSEIQVIETPGHTPGGVCFYSAPYVFVGDTLFAGSVGRTDLPGGDSKTLYKSLQRLKKLPDETIVVSGHGPDTTIGREKAKNPWLRDGAL